MLKRLGLIMLIMGLLSGCTSNASQPKAQELPDSRKPIQMYSVDTPPLEGGNEAETREVIPELTLEQLHKKFKSNFIFEGPSSPKRVALTFDDVPDRLFTLQVLDVLKSEGVKATFFVVGNRAKDNPDIIKRMLDDGHVLGNHSYSHANLNKVSDEKFHHEVLKTQEIVKDITDGYQMKYIRPPYGNIREKQIEWLVSQNIKVVNWNVDSLDWTQIDADEVEKNIMSQVKSGSIILQHGAGGVGEDLTGTVQALPRIVKRLREQGMEFVTLPQLLQEESVQEQSE